MPNSFNCSSVTTAGALTKGHAADCVFGKAITSRIELDPVINITKRSSPNAKPPCGGAPYLRASSKKPNFSRASSSPMPKISNTVCCIEGRLIRIEPPPTSVPFNTKSYARESAVAGFDFRSSTEQLGAVNG